MADPHADAEPSLNAARGEFGGNLAVLAEFHIAPDGPGSSNHVIDMWEHRSLNLYLSQAGLTNNRALFVNSHGAAFHDGAAERHYLHPHETLNTGGQSPPRYSAGDVAHVLGLVAASKIHIVVLTGCDENGALNLAEWRAVFPACTNIIHAPPGKLGYQPMLWQMIFTHSRDIQTLYESPRLNQAGETEYLLGCKPESWASRRLDPFVADLFEAGQPWPSRQQIAGRELFLPQTNTPRDYARGGSGHGK